MRFAVDTEGTFTDLVVEDDDGRLRMFKAQTTPHDPDRRRSGQPAGGGRRHRSRARASCWHAAAC